MIVDFENLDLVAERTIQLCGKLIPSEKVDRLKKLVDCNLISQKIIEIIKGQKSSEHPKD
jgi:hypothetical protein